MAHKHRQISQHLTFWCRLVAILRVLLSKPFSHHTLEHSPGQSQFPGGNALVPWGGSAFTNSSLFRSAMNKVQLVVDSTPFTAQQNTFSQWETISGYLPNLDPFNETFLVQKRVWRTDGLVNYNGYDGRWCRMLSGFSDEITRTWIVAVAVLFIGCKFTFVHLADWQNCFDISDWSERSAARPDLALQGMLLGRESFLLLSCSVTRLL